MSLDLRLIWSWGSGCGRQQAHCWCKSFNLFKIWAERLKLDGKMMKPLWVVFVVVFVFGKWVEGFLEFNDTELANIEAYVHNGDEISNSKVSANPLMVGLTLIQGAGAKRAGIHTLELALQWCYYSFLKLCFADGLCFFFFLIFVFCFILLKFAYVVILLIWICFCHGSINCNFNYTLPF